GPWDAGVVREGRSARLVRDPATDPGQEELSAGAERVDHVEIDFVLRRLRGRRADWCVMATEIRIVQTRIEPVRHGFRSVSDARDNTVDPVIEFDDVSVRCPSIGFRGRHGAAY